MVLNNSICKHVRFAESNRNQPISYLPGDAPLEVVSSYKGLGTRIPFELSQNLRIEHILFKANGEGFVRYLLFSVPLFYPSLECSVWNPHFHYLSHTVEAF